MRVNCSAAIRVPLWVLPLILLVAQTACEVGDTTAPQITIQEPSGVTTANRMPQIVIAYSDESGGSGVDTSTLSVTVDGKQTDVDCDPTTAGATCVPAADLPPGQRTITASIEDMDGNEGSDTATFTLTDALPPMIMMVEPANMVATTQTPQIRITYNDGNGVGVDTSTFTLALNGVDRTADCDVQAGESICSSADPLPAGMYTVDVDVSDNAGNLREMSFMFSVVLSIAVTIDEPADQLLTNEDAIVLSGTVGAEATSLSIGSRSVPVSGGTFSTSVELHEGINDITATAQGPGGATGAATIRVIRDTQPPVVTFDGPMDGSTVAAGRIAVTGTVQDTVVGPINNANCTVEIGGRTGFATADIENGTFVVEEFGLVMGANTISAIATDAVGNQSAPVSITVNRATFSGQRLQIIGGENQRGIIGQNLPQPVAVKALDANDQPLANRLITFTISKNNGKLDGENVQSKTVRTDENGDASVQWTLGGRAGRANNRLQITSPGFVSNAMASTPLPITVCASGMRAECAMLVPDGGDNQNGVAGQPLARPFVVAALDAAGNRCAGQTLVFEAVSGGGSFSNGESTIEVTTNAGGFATATLTLGMTAGINNNLVEVSTPSGEGNTVRFQASAFAPTADGDTIFTGIVLNTNNEPLEGANVHIHNADPPVETFTDASGQFTLTNVPLGNHLIVADGSTIGAGEEVPPKGSLVDITYPAIELVVDIIPGVENTLGRPMYLPALDPNAVGFVNEFSDTVLTMAGVPGFQLRIFAGSATFPDGSRSGEMSVTQVRNDQVPMPPNGGAAPPWVGTFQPPGVVFDPPVQLTVPNSLGLEPGQVVDLFSFNHELAMYINVGTGAVQPDGATIVSNPGSGITVSGWFFDCPPPPPPVELNNTDDVLNNKDIQQGWQEALDDSNPGARPLGPMGEHEEGGWIIQDSEGNVRVDRNPAGDEDSITVAPPNVNKGDTVIARFHTHPENPDFVTAPSPQDERITPGYPDRFGFDGSEFLGNYIVSCNEIWLVDPMGNSRQVSRTGPRPGD